MKKFLKIILILAILAITLVVIGLVVVTRPGFQKSIFLSVMKDSVDKVQVDTISAGTSKVDIKALDIEQNGAIVKLGDLTLTYSLWDYIFDKEIRIDELTLTGLYVDTTAMKPSEKSDKSDDDDDQYEDGGVPEFKGVFDKAEVPLKLFIGKINISGEVRMPQRQLTFAASGGDIAPGKEGNIKFQGELKDQTPGAAASQMAVDGALTLNQTDDQKLDRLSFKTDLSASGGSLSQPAKLTLATSAIKEADTEKYTLQLSRENQTLVTMESIFTVATESLTGGFTANVDRDALAPFLMGADVPDFTLAMDEKFTLNGKTEQFDVEGTLQLDLRNLAAWKPELADVGGGSLKANLKSTVKPDHILVETLDANFDTTNGRKLLALELKRQFAIQIEDDKPKLDGQPGELLSIQLTNLPVSWLNPFLPGISLSGGDISGATSIAATSQTDYTVESTTPWNVSNLTATKDGKPMLDSVNLALQPNVQISDGQTDVKTNLQATSNGKQLINGSVTVKMVKAGDELDATFSVQGDLAKLQAQPILEPYAGLIGGQYALDGKLDQTGDKKDFNATLSLTDLTTKDDFVKLPSAKLALSGYIQGSGDNQKINVSGPLDIKGVARSTDAKLTADIEQDGDVKKFTVDLGGNSLIVDQLQFLQRAFKNPKYTTETVTEAPVKKSTAPTGPDTAPAWSGLDGTFDLNFTQVIMNKSDFENLTGKLVINEQSLRITPLQAKLNGAPVDAKAVIDFRQGNPRPYLLDASLNLEGLEVGTLTSETGKMEDAGVTGVYTIKGSAGGDSPTLGEFANYALFDFDLKGTNGKLRTAKAGVKGLTLGTASSLTSALLDVTGVASDNPAVQQINSILAAISKDIEYDQISVEATRKKDFNVNLNEFVLVSTANNMKFKGQGKITYEEGIDLKEQPMLIQSQLWTKGKQLELLNKLKLVGQEVDKDGYQAGPKFDITGSLSQPDYYSSLASTLLGNVGNLALGLGGGIVNSAKELVTGDTSQDQNQDDTDSATSQKEQNKRAIGGLIQGFMKPKEQQQQQQQTPSDAPESGNTN